MKKLYAINKLIRSIFKKNWNFDDYPLETWYNHNASQPDIQYGASFINWTTFVAHGETKKTAIENLRTKYIEYKHNNSSIPRPGTKVPVKFTGTGRIDKYEEIAAEFFERIIGINYYNCFISDYSSLADFNKNDKETIDKIKNEYGIVPEGDLLLADIFEQISKEKLN